MSQYIRCSACHKPYPPDRVPYLCDCGGVYDYTTLLEFDKRKIDHTYRSIWRYSAFFGFDNKVERVSLGEGDTPLVEGDFNGHRIFYKMESLNPTGSFKDRGTAVLLSFLKSRGVKEAVEDSSGNAGASFAAYAARAGVNACIYIPESTSGPKRRQIEMYGARVIPVPGPRSAAAAEVLRAVNDGSVYASHAFMPFGLPGIATIAYEIAAGLDGSPGTIIAPVGHGSLLYGIMRGFDSLRAAGVIVRIPHYVGVQPRNCSPVHAAFESKNTKVSEVAVSSSIAEGTMVARPVRGSSILERVLGGAGRIIAADEPDIISVYQMLAHQGIYCEPTSALALIPLLGDKIELREPVIAIISGSGLKTNTLV